VKANEAFSIFGVVTPIQAEVTESTEQYLYYIADNRIIQVRYDIKDSLGQEILSTTREVTLEREYYKSDPIAWYPSVFEFEHEFNLDADPDTYTVELIALDKNGNEIPGTEEIFVVEYE
jgi:hypothetical protein